MKKDTLQCLTKLVKALNENNKLDYKNYLKSFNIKALRDIDNKKYFDKCHTCFGLGIVDWSIRPNEDVFRICPHCSGTGIKNFIEKF